MTPAPLSSAVSWALLRAIHDPTHNSKAEAAFAPVLA